MSQVTNVSIGLADPGKTDDKSQVTKTTSKQGTNDTVSVDACEDGTDSNRNAVVVLKVDSNGRSTARVDGSGNVYLDASGSGIASYMSVTLNSSDPNNWTVQVGTSGGSNYQFKKGNGGGGH